MATFSKVLNAIHIMPGIWIGTQAAAQDMDWLGAVDITTIVNVSGFDDEPIEDVDIFNYALNDHDLLDNEFERMLVKVHKIVNNVRDARRTNRNVLIHCKDCVNRAPLIAAFYLVRDLKYDPSNAISAVINANEKRDLEPRQEVIVSTQFDDDDKPRASTTEMRCRNVSTLTNSSFRKLIHAASLPQVGQK